MSSDNNHLGVLNNETSLNGTIEVRGNGRRATVDLKLTVEDYTTRPGLVRRIDVYNFVLARWESRVGRVAPLSDTTTEIIIANQVANYSNAAGDVRARLRWHPWNDESPTIDGWYMGIDLVKWTVN